MEIYAMPGHLIRRLNQISTGLFLERMNSLGLTLTPVQFAVLSALRLHPGIDQATVAGLVAYDRATIGKVIDKLENRGLLARSTARHDRRAKELNLTEAMSALALCLLSLSPKGQNSARANFTARPANGPVWGLARPVALYLVAWVYGAKQKVLPKAAMNMPSPMKGK